MLKREAELFLGFQKEHGSYRSRKISTIGLVINNSVFNFEEHWQLIDLIWS